MEPAIDTSRVRKILIVKLSSLGDIVHTLPVLPLLKGRFPEMEISWLVEKRHQPLLLHHPFIDRLLTVDTLRWRKEPLSLSTYRELFSSVRELRRGRFDLAIDFQGLIKSGLLTFLSGAPLRLGFGKDDLREPWSSIFLNRSRPSAPQEIHVVDKNLGLLKPLGIDSRRVEFPLIFSEEAERYVTEGLSTLKLTEFIIINPGGGWRSKRWSAEKYASLADMIINKMGYHILLTWGPGERALAMEIASRMRNSPAISFSTDIPQLIALIKRAKLLICGDSAPLHLAVACGTPVVGIYGPSDPDRNGPYNPADIVIRRKVPCAPCYKRDCDAEPCLGAIAPQKVFESVNRRLEGLR